MLHSYLVGLYVKEIRNDIRNIYKENHDITKTIRVWNVRKIKPVERDFLRLFSFPKGDARNRIFFFF